MKFIYLQCFLATITIRSAQTLLSHWICEDQLVLCVFGGFLSSCCPSVLWVEIFAVQDPRFRISGNWPNLFCVFVTQHKFSHPFPLLLLSEKTSQERIFLSIFLIGRILRIVELWVKAERVLEIFQSQFIQLPMCPMCIGGMWTMWTGNTQCATVTSLLIIRPPTKDFQILLLIQFFRIFQNQIMVIFWEYFDGDFCQVVLNVFRLCYLKKWFLVHFRFQPLGSLGASTLSEEKNFML